MSSPMSGKRFVLLVLVLGIIFGSVLGYMAWTDNVTNTYSSDIRSMCVENFGQEKEPLMSMYKIMSKVDIPKPYVIFDNRYKGASMYFTFDVLDNQRKIAHITTTVTESNKYLTEVTYDVSYEQIQNIENAAKLMVGADVFCDIPSTYYDYVPVRIQGNEYRWKDGVLERKR